MVYTFDFAPIFGLEKHCRAHTAATVGMVQSSDEQGVHVDVPRFFVGGLESDELANESSPNKAEYSLKLDPTIGAHTPRLPCVWIGRDARDVETAWRV